MMGAVGKLCVRPSAASAARRGGFKGGEAPRGPRAPAAPLWWIDLRRYGSVPHAGFGLGIERLMRWFTGQEHIRDMLPYPRTPARAYP